MANPKPNNKARARTNKLEQGQASQHAMTQSALAEFYNGEPPAYVIKAGKTYIIIKLSDWQGENTLTIRIDDVIEYYRTQAQNISSGMRCLAGRYGDWRPIDNLAKECLEWFKYINPKTLRYEGKKAGLKPKF